MTNYNIFIARYLGHHQALQAHRALQDKNKNNNNKNNQKKKQPQKQVCIKP